jgi:hypothetical protein
MSHRKQLVLIGKKLGGASYRKLVKVAQSTEDKSSFNTSKAIRSSPGYWNRLGLDKYKDQIEKILQTTATPNSEEWVKAVYNYQVKSPMVTMKDGILGPETFKAMTQVSPQLFPKSTRQTSKPQSPSNPYGKDLQQQVKEMGLVSLQGVASIKNHPYAHPKIRELCEKLVGAGAQLEMITEAYPPTIKHLTRGHSNGKAIDFTIKDPKYADSVVAFIKNQPGFKAVNEYKQKFSTTTGGHIHCEYVGSDTERVASTSIKKIGEQALID